MLLESKADAYQEFKFSETEPASAAALVACDFGCPEMMELVFEYELYTDHTFWEFKGLLRRAVCSNAEGAVRELVAERPK